MTDIWTDWAANPPESGTKVVIVCGDGCSTSLAMMTDDGALDGECGEPLIPSFLEGAIWAELPDNYPLAFTEITQDDWY